MNNYLNVGDKTIPYIILNKNNKNTYFRFKNKYLEISKSKYVSEQKIIEYVTNNFDMFYQNYLKSLKAIPKDNQIILEDKTYNLTIKQGKGFNYFINDDEIIVETNIKDLLSIKRKVYQLHIKQMVKQIEPNIVNVLDENNIKPVPFKYGYYKSKFGSYHKNNKEITLNIVLAKTNINYLYYVIMHEYAHTKVFNHSKQFYLTLEKLMPNYLQYDKTIKKLSIWI